MFPTKSILETLAALGTGAILLGGCAGSQTPVNSTEVPAAEVKTEAPADAKEAAPTETASGGATAGSTTGASDNAAATPAKAGTEPTKAGTEPAAAAAPAGSGAPVAAPATTTKPKPKKTAGTKKPGAAGSCGEGTCG